MPPAPRNAAELGGLLASLPHVASRLARVRALGLPDCWIAAGLIRNAVWDHLHGLEPQPPNDVDVVYLDRADASAERDARIAAALQADLPGPWEVANQARMHLRHGHAPYADTAAAIARWVETATAIGARMEPSGRVEIVAPHGIGDLVGLILRPAPGADGDAFRRRMADKGWLRRYPRLSVRES